MEREVRGRIGGEGRRITIVAGRFNRLVATELVEGARECLLHHGVAAEAIDVVWTPGSLELPLAAQALLARGGQDAIVAVGCVIKGETSHDEVVVREACSGLLRLSLEHRVPIGIGIVHAPTVEAALERAGVKMAGRGWEAAQAALEMLDVLGRIGEKGAGRGRRK